MRVRGVASFMAFPLWHCFFCGVYDEAVKHSDEGAWRSSCGIPIVALEEKSSPSKRPRGSRKGPLTSKPARVSPKGPQT
eukprot:549600-Pelagomonas_calceolata.AAC.2